LSFVYSNSGFPIYYYLFDLEFGDKCSFDEATLLSLAISLRSLAFTILISFTFKKTDFDFFESKEAYDYVF